MKYVINRCFGGYSLSTEVVERYFEKKGIKYVTSFNPRLNNFFAMPIIDDALQEHFYAEIDIARNDPQLIEAIEELGLEKSSGMFSDLSIVEVPDDAEVEVLDYDGLEYLAEKHRTWR